MPGTSFWYIENESIDPIRLTQDRKELPMLAHRAVMPILVLGLICALCPALRAGGVEVKFGLQAGLNLAKATYDPPPMIDEGGIEDKFRSVFGCGGIVSLTFTGFEPLSLESGLLLQMKGGKTNVPVHYAPSIDQYPQESTWVINWKLLYLTVPLRARVSFKNTGYIPYVKTGLDFDILITAKYADFIIGATDYPGSERDIDNGSALDVALVGGAGVEFPTGRVRMFIEATYCHGLRNVLDPADAEFVVKLHNRVIGIMAGVRF